MIHRVRVENLPSSSDAQSLHRIFSEAGSVAWIYVEIDEKDRLPWGYAYAGFTDLETAERAVELVRKYEGAEYRLQAQTVEHGPDEYFDKSSLLTSPLEYIYSQSQLKIEGGKPSTPLLLDGIEKATINEDGTALVTSLLPGKYTVSFRTHTGTLFSKRVIVGVEQTVLVQPDAISQPQFVTERYQGIWVWAISMLIVFGLLPIALLIWLYNRTAVPTLSLPINEIRQLQPPPGMVLVKASRFIMGRFSEDPFESPPHTVEVSRDFFIDRTEVTNRQYYDFVKVNNRPAPKHWRTVAPSEQLADLPVVHVSWQDAVDYCNWRSSRAYECRLPTEAEWELAARGSNGQIYPWGNTWVEGAANAEGVRSSPAPVASFKLNVSPVGAYDMVGNVWEWVADDLILYPLSKAAPQTGVKVVRGGSFSSDRNEATGTFRGFLKPDSRDYDRTGFRCACD